MTLFEVKTIDQLNALRDASDMGKRIKEQRRSLKQNKKVFKDEQLDTN